MINSRNYLQDRSIFVGYACEINVYQEIKKLLELRCVTIYNNYVEHR